jgi:ribulose-phosphate 3-epimerase
MLNLKIAPSILSADFGRLNEEIASIEDHADWLHIDVMDGHFVSNLTLGAPIVKALKTKLFKDCHLMVTYPERLLEDFVKAGAQAITVHAEATDNLPGLIELIKDYGVRAGVSIKPRTPVSAIAPVLGQLDLVLVMTVEPGFGGQSFRPECVDKIREIRQLAPDLDISVDGGVNVETAKICVEAGANILVAGSAVFGEYDRVAAIKNLRDAALS